MADHTGDGENVVDLDLFKADAKQQERRERRNAALIQAASLFEDIDPDKWMDYLAFSAEGGMKPLVHNALLMLEYHTDIVGCFGMTALGHNPMIIRPVPWDQEGKFPRRFEDGDIVHAAGWLERKGLQLSRDAVGAVMAALACRRLFDPIADYLNGLVWDKKQRLDKMLTYYFGVDDNAATRAMSRKFMVAAVARALSPGSKVDNILVLEGPQGLRKSTSIKTLFGAEWTLETMMDIGSKDARQQIGAYWAVELPELDHLSRAETEKVKAWMSTQVDDFRPPYARFNIRADRRCVFIGTHNPGDGWLDDPTGARRFWVVECTGIDVEGLAEDRDHIWAEAVNAFYTHEQWWFNDHDPAMHELEALEHVRAAQDVRFVPDAWHNRIAAFILETTVNEISVETILGNIGVSADKWDRRMQTRVGKVMTKIGGWKKCDKGAKAKERYVYRRITPLSQQSSLPVAMGLEEELADD